MSAKMAANQNGFEPMSTPTRHVLG